MYINENRPLNYNTEVQCFKIVLSSNTFLVWLAKSTSRKHELLCFRNRVIKLDSNGQSSTELLGY